MSVIRTCGTFAFILILMQMRDVIPQPVDLDFDPDLVYTPPTSEECWEPEFNPGEFEYGEYFEGDMNLDADQLAAIHGERKMVNEEKYRWPNGIVPFVISENYTDEENDLIIFAFKSIEQVSCVKFLPRTNETDYVQIEVSEYDF